LFQQKDEAANVVQGNNLFSVTVIWCV